MRYWISSTLVVHAFLVVFGILVLQSCRKNEEYVRDQSSPISSFFRYSSPTDSSFYECSGAFCLDGESSLVKVSNTEFLLNEDINPQLLTEEDFLLFASFEGEILADALVLLPVFFDQEGTEYIEIIFITDFSEIDLMMQNDVISGSGVGSGIAGNGDEIVIDFALSTVLTENPQMCE